jgi:hypothetical protein
VAGFDALNFDNSWLVLRDHRHIAKRSDFSQEPLNKEEEALRALVLPWRRDVAIHHLRATR